MAKVAMLGKWHVHAEVTAQNVRQYGSRILWVWDEDDKRGIEWSGRLGVPFESSLNKILEDPAVDAVIISNATARHKEVVLAAANAGKHIYCEKPLAPTTQDCREIEQAIKKAGVKFTLALPYRIHPVTLFARQQMKNGSLGQISMFRHRYAHGGAFQNWLPEHWYNEKESWGGALIDLGADSISIATYLFGRPKKVVSMMQQRTSRGVEDSAVCIIEFQCGTTAVIETGFMTPCSPSTMELHGTRGSLIVAHPDRAKLCTLDTKAYTNGMIKVDRLPPAADSPLKSFLDAVDNDGPAPYGLEDAYALTEVLEMAYQNRQ